MNAVKIKCRALMVGDWVTNRNGSPMQIVAVDEDNAYACEGNEERPWIYGDDEDYKPEPIILTPEILEKNGFERGVITPSKFYRNIDNERLMFCSYGSCYGLGYVHWNESNDADIMHRLEVQQPIMYIHQMQNALRLFGLDQLADNFKV